MSCIFMATALLSLYSCESKIKKDNTFTPESAYVQIATGQTVLYDKDGKSISREDDKDSCYGQDADYLKGKKMAYTKNEDGTITDQNTGLMWQEIPYTEGFSWKDAVEYCEDLKLASYDDWRAPSAKELYSISDFSSGWPYIDTTYFSLASGEIGKQEQYWTLNNYVGTTEEGGYSAAFGVNHVTGHIKAYAGEAPSMKDGKMPAPPNGPQGTKGQGTAPPPPGGKNGKHFNPLLKYVRAVRGQAYGINEFTDNKNGTISDKASALMWTKDDNKEGLNWEDALNYAENSKFAGYSDWRLPNVKELQGIVDYSYAPGAQDSTKNRAAIDPIFNCASITNEAGVDDFPYYWTSTSAHFTKGKPYYYAWYVAFGRAVNAEGVDFHGAGAVRFDTKHKNGPAGEGGERYYNYVRLVRNIK
ncbi:DUF1566 domain-containing protein [Labilibaculum sp.]|uniref:Lcl C-terminal domain-containing protein n=1 Tax=Labilibaculum sp. TaxID=2060723 RepID=UPI0035690AC4